MKSFISAVCVGIAFTAPVQAADWVFVLGATHFDAHMAVDSGLVAVEVHGAPFHHLGRVSLSLAAAVELHGNGDVWLGGGLSALLPLGNSAWFAEAALMPGLFVEADTHNDLGSLVEFRSLLGIGYRFSDRDSLSLGVHHISNAGLSAKNPGMNAVSLRWRRSF